MLAVKGLNQRLFERRMFRVGNDHAHPRDGLQQRPVRTQRGGQRDGNGDFSEPDEHDEILEYNQAEVNFQNSLQKLFGLQMGRFWPVVVTISLPCLTPLAVINSSAIFLTRLALPRTTSTSRQLSWSRWT